MIAAALSLPKTLFRTASPFIHTDADEYNEIVQKSFSAAIQFDENSYSEPIMMLRLFIEHHRLAPEARFQWAKHHNIAHARLKLFVSLVNHLAQRVNHVLSNASALDVSRLRKPSTIVENRLRLILAWTFSDNLIVQQLKNKTITTASEVQVNPATPLSLEQVQKLLPHDSIEYSFCIRGNRIYRAAFSGKREDGTLSEILSDLMRVSWRLGVDLVWIDQRAKLQDSKTTKKDGMVVFGVSLEDKSISVTYGILNSIFPADQLNFSEVFEKNLRYGIMIAEKVSKKQTKLLNQLSSQFDRCLSLQLYDDADPKLIVCNFAVEESDLYLIFTGDPTPLETCKVSVETISEHQVITFPVPTAEDKGLTQKNSSMIDDHPIGYRLLATYGLCYKDK